METHKSYDDGKTHRLHVPSALHPQPVTLKLTLPPGDWDVTTSVGRESGLLFVHRVPVED